VKRIIAWTLFDFANSSYSAVIAAVVFPVYFATVIVGNSEGMGDLWWGRAISLSMFIVAVTSPFLGGIADASGRRKSFFLFYTAVAIVSVMLFTTLRPGLVIYGFLLIVIANTGVEGGFVFYNSYLPLIADREKIGRISAAGFAVGYVGSIVALLLAIFFIQNEMIEMVWIEVGSLFTLFSVPVFLLMPRDEARTSIFSAAGGGLQQTFRTIKSLFRKRDSLFFLTAYFLYTDGVNTVIVFASIFAVTTLHFSSTEAILLFLVVQISALIGSFAISFPIDRVGPLKIVRMSLVVWIMTTIYAFFVSSKMEFYFIAVTAGLVLGTIQAASRALYTYFIPKEKEAEYFGVYSTVGKTSSILGPLMFGLISNAFHSQRPAVMSVSILFVLGLVALSRVKIKIS